MIGVRLILATWALATVTRAQPFNSGSDGSDGALVLTEPGVVDFQKSPNQGAYFQFTSVHIGAGVHLRFSSRHQAGPVVWLSQGPVVIDGELDLDAQPFANRSWGGAGGYPGGAKGRLAPIPGEIKRNDFLVPLIGGQGGRGGPDGPGGGGGGALLIASSVSIAIHGPVHANGGRSVSGEGGAGGAIRLVAPVISGSGAHLAAEGGAPSGVPGRIRLEFFENRLRADIRSPMTQGRPLGLFLPTVKPPNARIAPDSVRLSSPGSGQEHRVIIEAESIPPGVVLGLECLEEDGSAVSVSSTPLEGTLARSRALAVLRTDPQNCLVTGDWSGAGSDAPSRKVAIPR